MFNVIEKNQKLTKGIMIAVTASFVLWGISGYISQSSDDGYVAKIGDQRIYPKDIDQAMESQKGANRKDILAGLINRSLIIENANYYNLTASDSELQAEILKIPEFQNAKGDFSIEKYQNYLKFSYTSAEQFQKNVSKQIIINKYVNLFKQSYIQSAKINDKFAQLISHDKVVAPFVLPVKQFIDQVKLTDKEIKTYYTQSLASYILHDKVKFQYITLDLAAISSKIDISDDRALKYINKHPELSDFKINASHILFNVDKKATKTQVEEVKTKAQKILDQVKKNPSLFASLAKQYSQDTGSATNGGDLGTFGKGIMVKPFEQKVLTMKAGEISDLVRTDFGFHIIKLNSIKQDSQQDLLNKAKEKLKTQDASMSMQKYVDKLNSLSYNNPKDLNYVAKTLGFTVNNSDWVEKGAKQGDFAIDSVQKVLFNQDVINKGENTEVVNVAKNKYMVFHITNFQPGRMQTLAEVHDKVVEELKKREARTLAVKAAVNKLQALQSNKTLTDVVFGKEQTINYLFENNNVTADAVQQIFTTRVIKYPAYQLYFSSNGDVIIYKVISDTLNLKTKDKMKKIVNDLDASTGYAALSNYLEFIRGKYKVTERSDKLNSTDV